ncbi:MAG TPA: type II secretion system secretin GspD, partial [Anaeromyxobacteraceae bacterium]
MTTLIVLALAVTAPAARAAEVRATPPPGPCHPLEGRFLLAFSKAEIVDVLEQASRWTCRNLAYTEEVARGKITLLSKVPVTAEEAFAAFLVALSANNLAIYRSGQYDRLIRIADAKKVPIPTLVEDGAEVPATEQPVTKLFRLRYADTDQLRGILGNYTSPQGADIQAISPDMLIVTDLGLNVHRIERLIDAIDRPGAGEFVHFIQVEHASAQSIADKVNQVFQGGPNQAGAFARRSAVIGVAPSAPAAGGPNAGEPRPPERNGGSMSKTLADERTNKLLVVADDKTFERVQDFVAQLDVPTAGEGQIHVVHMKYAVAEDLAQTLQALARGDSSSRRPAQGAPGSAPAPPAVPQGQGAPAAPGGPTTTALLAGEVKITADKVANALVVLASTSDFAILQRLIERRDRPRRQVLVEAVIMEVNLQDESQFGVSMHALIPYKTADGTGYIPIGSETGRLNSLSTSSLTSLGGLLSGFVGPTSSQLSSVLPGVSSVSVLVQALQTNSNVRVLSTPHILATDNEDAEISVGQNVPFQTGYSTAANSTSSSSSSTTSAASVLGSLTSQVAGIQRQNVELRLRIKPQITEGDSVRLTIEEQTEEIASKDAVLGPTTAKRSVKTSISVKNESTIVIGGLIQERKIESVHKTPLLGDIPVLGYLFRDRSTTTSRTNLLLFLTPYIIHGE